MRIYFNWIESEAEHSHDTSVLHVNFLVGLSCVECMQVSRLYQRIPTDNVFLRYHVLYACMYSPEHKTLAHSGGHALYLQGLHLMGVGIDISNWDLFEISTWKRGRMEREIC